MSEAPRQIPEGLVKKLDVWAKSHNRPYKPCIYGGDGQVYTPGQIVEEVKAGTPAGQGFVTHYFDWLRTPDLYAPGTIERKTRTNVANFPHRGLPRLRRDFRNLADRFIHQTPFGTVFR